MAFDHAAHMFAASLVAGGQRDRDTVVPRSHHRAFRIGEGKHAHPVALVIAGGHLVAPVADKLLDIALRLLAMREAGGDKSVIRGTILAQKPCSFSIRSRRLNTLRALPSKIACFSSSEISRASI